MKFEAVGEDLRRTLAMLNEIAQRQLPDHNVRIAQLRAESAVFQRRTEQNLAEITGKLDRLIGGTRPPDEN